MSAVAHGAEGPLERERRLRPRYAAAAVTAAVLLMGAAVIQMIGPHTSISEVTLGLIYANKRTGLDILASIVSALGSLVIAATLVFLIDAARARNPEVASFVRVATILGALLAAVSGVIYAIIISSKAHQFATSGSQTFVEAHQLTTSGGLIGLQLAGLLGALLVALSLVLVSVQAMRVGLLTRFMGYLGMFAGALVLFQITPLPVVETYWFVALAVLFAGRWPTGEPLAWKTGRAEKWPTSQEVREQRIRAAGGGEGAGRSGGARTDGKAERGGGGKSRSTDVIEAPANPARNGGGARTGAKRKRKHRR
jgi:hypothetical protein